MQFNVAQLLQEPIGASRTHELAEDIEELDPELVILGPLVGKVTALRTNSGVLITGKLSTAVRVTCSRCLAPIVVPVRFEIEESFRPLTEVHTGRYLRPDEFEGLLEELDDEALLIDEHHILDLSEVVRQDIWLALPMIPGCNWKGPGTCPNLLEHLSAIEGLQTSLDEESTPEAIDPRWSVLLDLREQLDDTESEGVNE